MEVRTRFAKIELPFFFVIQTSQNQSGYNLHMPKKQTKNGLTGICQDSGHTAKKK